MLPSLACSSLRGTNVIYECFCRRRRLWSVVLCFLHTLMYRVLQLIDYNVRAYTESKLGVVPII